MSKEFKKITNLENLDSKDIEELKQMKKELKKYSKKIINKKEHNSNLSSIIGIGCLTELMAFAIYGGLSLVMKDNECLTFCMEGLAATSLIALTNDKLSIRREVKLDKELSDCDDAIMEVSDKIYKKIYR